MRLSADNLIEIGKLALLAVGALYAFKAYKGLKSAGDSAGGAIGGWYADLTSPGLVEPQIRLQSRYFTSAGMLTTEAEKVISEGYPNLYAALFWGGRIRPQYAYLIDSGQPLKDSDYA